MRDFVRVVICKRFVFNDSSEDKTLSNLLSSSFVSAALIYQARLINSIL